MRKGLKNLYNYDFTNEPDAGPYGTKRAYATDMCMQTFIGRLEGDGKKCKDQDNAPGKEINEAGEEVTCSKYIPRKNFEKNQLRIYIFLAHLSNWELKKSDFRPNGW